MIFEEFVCISFPDCDVISFNVDLKALRIEVVVDDAFVDEPQPRWLGETTVELTEWTSLRVRAFDHSNHHWIDLEAADFDPLKDIAEFERRDRKSTRLNSSHS